MAFGILSLPSAFLTHKFIAVDSAMPNTLIQFLIVFPIGATGFSLGVISLYKIGHSNNLKGTWMAIIGLVGGSIVVAVYLIMLLFMLALVLHLYVI